MKLFELNLPYPFTLTYFQKIIKIQITEKTIYQ